MKKKFNVIISKDDSDSVSDWSVVGWYESLKDGDTVRVATSVMFNEVRVGVALGQVEPFEFEYEGETLSVKEDGQLYPYWPNGFGDHQIIQMDMMVLRVSREEATRGVYEDGAKNIEREKKRLKI